MKKLISIVSTHRIPVTGMLTMIVLVIIVYSTIGEHRFLNWDDIDYIHKNDRIKSFSIDNIIWMFSNFSMANWHPLTWLSYTFNYTIWQDNPVPYKITNIILHILNSMLVYVLTVKFLTAARKNFHTISNSRFSLLGATDFQYAGVFAAIIFAVHPLHVESVTWISERKDVLYSLFFMLTIWFYLNYKESNENRKWLIASIFMFLFSLMSKPMSVTTPVLLMLIDIYPLNVFKDGFSVKKAFRTLIPNKTTYLLLAFFVAIITILTQRAGIQGSEHLAIDSRIVNASMSLLQYAFHFFWPVNLSTFYSLHPWSTDPNIYSIFPVAIVFTITIFFFYLAIVKNIYFPVIGWLYFLICVSPVIGIVKVGAQAAADRYTYMPLLSFFIISPVVVVLLAQLAKSRKIRSAVNLTLIFTLGSIFTYLSYQQNMHWKDDQSLWTKAINYSPGTAAIPYSNLATMYYNNGNFNSAILELNKSLAIAPDDVLTMEQLGKAYELMNRDRFAVNAYKKLIATHPEHPLGYIRLGDFYYKKHKLEPAKRLYEKAFSLMPTVPSTLQRSALVDYLNRNYPAAEEKLDYLLKLSSNDTGSLQLLAKIKTRTGQHEEAKSIAQRLLKKNPDDTFARELLQQIGESDKPEQDSVPVTWD